MRELQSTVEDNGRTIVDLNNTVLLLTTDLEASSRARGELEERIKSNNAAFEALRVDKVLLESSHAALSEQLKAAITTAERFEASSTQREEQHNAMKEANAALRWVYLWR
jgi:hypothetical protein